MLPLGHVFGAISAQPSRGGQRAAIQSGSNGLRFKEAVCYFMGNLSTKGYIAMHRYTTAARHVFRPEQTHKVSTNSRAPSLQTPICRHVLCEDHYRSCLWYQSGWYTLCTHKPTRLKSASRQYGIPNVAANVCKDTRTDANCGNVCPLESTAHMPTSCEYTSACSTLKFFLNIRLCHFPPPKRNVFPSARMKLAALLMAPSRPRTITSLTSVGTSAAGRRGTRSGTPPPSILCTSEFSFT